MLDISDLWNIDEDAELVYPNIAETGVYHDRRLAAPTAQSIMGVYVNKTLFEQNNVELPPYDWNYDQMIELAKQLSNPSEHYYGIDGAWGNLMFEEHFPMQDDENLRYNMWDGEKFNFSDEAWIEGYNKKSELIRLKVYENMTGEEKLEEFGAEDAWPPFIWSSSNGDRRLLEYAWLPKQMEESGAGELDFYPYPGGKAGQRMPVVLDYMGASSTTKHPEAAYELMKFMSYGKDGWINRLEVYQELDINVVAYPVADYPEVWETIPGLTKLEGAKAALELLDNAVPDFNKWMPGWMDYNAWVNEEGIFDKLNNGEITPADKAQELEDRANQFVQEAIENMK